MDLLRITTEQLTPKNLLGLLALCFFTIQPWNRHLADVFWLLLSMISLCYVVSKKYHGHTFNTPKPLKTLLYLCALMPLVSLISFLTSPLDTLELSLLEPDTRWLLIIPVILAMRDTHFGPQWILVLLFSYAISTLISASSEIAYLTHLYKRADGDENAVPYGMFNATVALMLLTYFISPYIKQITNTKAKVILVRGLVFIVFILASIAAFLSGTRAAVLLIPIVIVIIYSINYGPKKALMGMSILLILGITVLAVSPNSAFKTNLKYAYTNTSNYFLLENKESKLNSMGQRLEQWKESWCIFKLHPLLGTGPRSFQQAHQAYGGKSHCNAVQYLKQGSYQAHSMYFNTLGTLGITGIILTLILFLTFLHTAITALKKDSTVSKLGGSLLLTVITCHAINGITLDLWFMNHVMDKNLIVLAIPLVLIFYKQEQKTLPFKRKTTIEL